MAYPEDKEHIINAKYFLASIVESSQDSIVTIDFNGIITTWNKAAEQLYGYPASQAIGNDLMTLVFPQDLGEVLTNIERVKRSQRVEIFEGVRIHSSGREMTLEVVMSPVKNDDGQVIGVSMIARDVTQRREAEAALQESEEKYHTLFDSIDEGYCTIEVLFDGANKPYNWRFLEVNPAFEKNNGLKNATGKTILELTPDIEPKWFDIYGRIAQTGEPQRFQEQSAALNRHFDLYAFRIGAAHENNVAVIFTDITARKRAEEALRESEERLRTLAENLPGGAAFIVDRDLRYLTAAGEAFISAGFSPEDFVGRTIYEALRPELAAEHEPKYRLALAGKSYEVEHEAHGRTFLTRGVPLRAKDGDVYAVLAVSYDITLRREAEKALLQAHAELEKRVEERTRDLRAEVVQRRALEEQRTQLIQRVVNVQEEERRRVARELHDNLGQHLTAIMLGVQALQAQSIELPSGERRSTFVGLNRLHEMINDLAGIAHRLAWELRPAALDNIGLEAALQQYVSQWASQSNVTQSIMADFVSHLGDNDTGLSGEAKTALYRVTQEALTNVLRHAKATRVSVVLERQKSFITVIVEDNGQGFSVEEVHTKNRLGVVGMRERLELIGGTLEVESQPGHGTTVYARVPLNFTE